MARSPHRPPRPPTRTPQPMAEPAAAAAAGGGEEEEEEEEDLVICEENGFVYKRPRGLSPDAAPSSTQAPAPAVGPDPEVARLRRRRRALLRLREKRLGELSRWEALASQPLAPLPAPRPLDSPAPPASPDPVAATATASASDLDDLLAQAEVQAELLKRVSQWCDEIHYLCDAHEESIFDSVVALPVWGKPAELMASLCSPDEPTDPGCFAEENRGFQGLDIQRSKRTIEAAGAFSVAVPMIEKSGEKQKGGRNQCERCFRFDRTEKTCCETPGKPGDERPATILSENRKRRGAGTPGFHSVGAQTPNKSRSKKASGSTYTPSSTPRSTRSKAPSIPARTPEPFLSPGPTTRRRAAAA